MQLLDKHLYELYEILNMDKSKIINNTIIVNYLVYDLCENSNIIKGLRFSDKAFEFMNKLKEFNYKNIYLDERLKPCTEYFKLVINTIFDVLKRYYDEKEHIKKIYPDIISDFEKWLELFWNRTRKDLCTNKIIFNIDDKKDFYQAIIYYISGMTDNYAIDFYNKIIRF